jgi:hypothetical protein
MPKTLEEVLQTALDNGWIDAARAASFRKHHSDGSVPVVIKSIAEDAGLDLTRAITAALSG